MLACADQLPDIAQIHCKSQLNVCTLESIFLHQPEETVRAARIWFSLLVSNHGYLLLKMRGTPKQQRNELKVVH